MKCKHVIGVPSFDASKCYIFDEDGKITVVGRRKAQQIIFQAALDGDYIHLVDNKKFDGHTLTVIQIIDRKVFEAFKSKLGNT